MAYCIPTVVVGDDGPQPACMVHTAYLPCFFDGEPATLAPIHTGPEPSRDHAIHFWEERTGRQRPLHIHRGDWTDGTHRVEVDGVCWCGPEILPAEMHTQQPERTPQ